MEILIYDNCIDDANKIIMLVSNLLDKKYIDYSLNICPSITYLFENIQKVDILFLDIELDEINGIQLGLEVKKLNPSCHIIITSQFNKYLIDGYKVQATRYFLKPINESEFNQEMTIIINDYFKKFQKIFDEKICSVPVYVKDILYIEARNKQTILHMSNGHNLKTPYSLKYWLEKFENNFFAQSHKAFYINLNYISGIKKTDVFLVNDELVPLSRNYKKSFELAYTAMLYEIV